MVVHVARDVQSVQTESTEPKIPKPNKPILFFDEPNRLFLAMKMIKSNRNNRYFFLKKN